MKAQKLNNQGNEEMDKSNIPYFLNYYRHNKGY
jgi:hypothetical protein